MGAINAMPSYQDTFGLSGDGSSTGIIFIIYNIGQIAAFPFCGIFADGYGRRVCIFIGCLVVAIGTAIQVSANSTGQYIGGRFLLGFGAAIASAAGPTYIVELAHPAYRGPMAGMYNNFWWLGNILAGWTTVSARIRAARFQSNTVIVRHEQEPYVIVGMENSYSCTGRNAERRDGFDPFLPRVTQMVNCQRQTRPGN